MTRVRPEGVPTDWRIQVTVTSINPAVLVFCVATAGGQVLTKDLDREGAPIRSDMNLQAGQKTAVLTVYDYNHITAPMVK
jgi:hypothetical protein